MMSSLLLLVLVCTASALRNYTSSMPLSSDGTVLLWSVQGQTLQLAVQAPSRGWVAVGFASTQTNAMISNGAGSDITMGYIDAGACSAGCLGNYGTTTYPAETGSPAKSATTTSVLVAMSLSPQGIMTMEFDRPLASTGVVLSVPRTMIWAYNPSPSAVTSATVFQKHLSNTRGTAMVTFGALGMQTNPELAPPVSVKSGYTSPDGVWVATWTTSNGVISFEVTVKRSGDYWGAIGFNTQDSMVGADIALGYVSSSNVATVTDRHATAHAEPSVDSVNNLVLVSGTRDAASTVFRFSRSLTVTDTNDVDLSSNVFMLWAYGQYDGNSGAIFKHANKGTVTGLQFATDCYDYGLPRATNATLTTSSLSVLLPVHGLLAVLSFACVGPLGSVAAVTRLSGTKLWFPIHIVLHVVSLASAVAAFVIIFVAKSGVLTVDVHQIMGIVVFGLSFVQAGVGLLSHFMYDKNRVSTPIFPDAVHHWFGRALFVLATVTMFYGLVTLRTLYGLPSSVAPFALLALTIAIPLVFYLVLLIRGRKTGPVSQGYNMGQGEDFSASTQGKGVASAAKTLFVIACVAALVAFGGFVVTLYVPRYSYGGGSVATPNSFSLNVPTKGCFAMDRYSLPPSLTAYKCRGFQFPNSPQQHAYSFSPVIDKAAVVHHIILYRTATYLGDAVFDCSSMPAGSSPFWAWAVGGGDFVPPSNTAFEAAPFFALQIHYNNPALSPTFVDSSGVKISFTPQKPQDKSVFLQVGVATSRISLPPRQTTHLSYTCSATSVIPVGASVEIWANGLHAHLRGKKIWIEHIRNSARIGFIGCNLFYDFNKQSFEMRNATIQRGDSIKIHCQYDTTQETSTVVGGEATTNEMCLAFLPWYGRSFEAPSDLQCYGSPVIETPVGASVFC